MGHGFLLSDGTFTSVEPVGSIASCAGGINNAGHIVGTYFDGITGHGFLLSGGSFAVIDFPGALWTSAWGVNDAGQITGAYDDGTALHAFLATPDPASLLSDLIALVETFNLRRGIENSLDAKLQNAEAALTAAGEGSLGVACNLLDAFINEVEAQSGHALTVDQANQLITMANQVKAALNCP